jgi:hypothetical protein
VVGLVALLCGLSYCKGASSADSKWTTKVAQQQATIATLNAKNAQDALTRAQDRAAEKARLDTAVATAKDEVRQWYAQHPVDPRVVETTKLVPVPGKPEYVYVPNGVCPNDMFDPDELLLFNGEKPEGHNPNPEHPK